MGEVSESSGNGGAEPIVASWERPVFVYAPGRSGSTPLALLLNCMPGLTVWGEHAGIVRQLTEAFTELTDERNWSYISDQRPAAEALAADRPPPPPDAEGMTMQWANSFEHADLIAAFRDCVMRMFTAGLPPDRRWGFKEIRYRRREYDFLRMLFPWSQAVMLTRDPASMLSSQLANFALGDPASLDPSLDGVIGYFEFVRDLPAEQPFAVVDRSALAADPEALAEHLAAFLDEELDRDQLATLAAQPRPDPALSPYEEGGTEAVAARITELYVANDVVPYPAKIDYCAGLYHELRIAQTVARREVAGG